MPNNAFKTSITSLLMGIIRKLRVLLASRNLFHNWLSAGIKYYLIKYHFTNEDIAIRFRCDNNKKYVLNLQSYALIVNSYYDNLFKLMCNGEVIGRFFGIIDLIYSNGEFLLRMPDGILLTIDSYSFNPLIIAETWLYDIHFLGFDLSDWFVLDIGAFVGDTALYYARRGAFVVAVEPLPSYYEAMLRNLELNPELKSRIISINAAISSEDGFVKFRTTIDGSESIYGTDRFVTRTRSIKLSTLINELGSRGIDISKFRVRVLKADCKGCEYELMNDGSLRLFDIAKIEYSGYLINKTYHELMSKLEELGFRCRVWAHNEFAIKIGLDKHGTMTCIKKNEMIIR